MTHSTLHSLLRTEFTRAGAPPPTLTVSEWADQYGVLSAESSAEPGPWRTYPYQKAMMDAFCAPEVERVVTLKSARIGWTKILGHVIGYHIHLDPCSMLIVQPTIDDAEGWSKEELTTAIEDTPVLLERVGDQKSRATGNTINKKHYPGGILHVIGANSPRGFRRITVRLTLFDEVDGYPPTAGTEGDQIKLGEKRTETFWNRKIGIGSTPTEKDFSRIEKAFERSSKGHFMLRCPECGGEHIRLFRQPEDPIVIRERKIPVSHLHWEDGKPETAAWVCPDCGSLIDHSNHRRMMQAGYWLGEHWEWRQETGFTFLPGFAGDIGFRIWAGYSYSPNSTPAKLVKEFLAVKEDPEELKTYVNTVLGETYEERGEKVSGHTLLDRCEPYEDEVPDGVILTMGCDVQADRIEAEIVAWSPTLESWSIDYQILPGETTQDQVWDDLLELTKARYRHANGMDIGISSVCVDSGYLPEKVYDFCRRAGMHCYPTKGVTGQGRPVVEPLVDRRKRLRKTRAKKGVRPELVGVDEGKSVIQRQLKVAVPGPGYCHFPEGRDEEYFLQLTAEKLVVRYKKGRPFKEWVATRPRNEALDNRVLAYAALLLAGGAAALKPLKAPSDTPPPKRTRRPTPGHSFGSEEWAIR